MTLHRPIAALLALTLLGQSFVPVFVYAASVPSNPKSVTQQGVGVDVSAPVETTLSATDSVPMDGQEVIDIRTAPKLSGLRVAAGESTKASVTTPTMSVRRVPSAQKGRVLVDVSLEAIAQSETLRQVDTDLIKRLSPQLVEVDTPKEEKKPVESAPSLREKIRSFLTTFFFVPTAQAVELTPFIETYDGIEKNRMDFLLQSLSGMQNSDGSIGTTDRYMISADAMMLLNRYRRTDSDQFDLLLSYLQTATTTNNRESAMRARLASAWGEDPIPLLDSLIAQQSTEDGSIPFAPGYAPDLSATLEFAVALAAANYSIDNALPKALHYVLTRIPDSGQMRYTAGGEPSYVYGADVARKLKPFAAFSVGIGGGGPSISVQPKITALLNYVQSQYDTENGTLLGTDDPSDQLSVVRALRAYDVNAPMQQTLADVAVQTQTADGSLQYSPYATIAGFDVFAHSDLQISTAVVNGTLRNRTTVPFTVTVHNRGYTTVSSSVLHFFIDTVNLGATVDLGANGVTLGPDDSAVLTVNYPQSAIINRVLGPTEFTWYLDTPAEAVGTTDNNWFSVSATVEPPTTAAPATPLYYTAVPIESTTVPKISFRWHSRIDANRRNYIVAYRVSGTVSWSYLAVSPNQTGTTISGFTEGVQYDVTVGVLYQNGSTLTIDPSITTIRATVTPTLDGVVQGTIKGDVSAQISIASVTEDISVATTTAGDGSFGANNIVTGRHAFAASAAQYQGVMTVAGLAPTVTTTMSIFTRLKPDDVAPSVSSLSVAGGIIKSQRDNVLVVSSTDNVAVKEVDVYYFDDVEQVWLFVATVPADTSNVAMLTWYAPSTVTSTVSVRAIAHDYRGNSSAPFTLSDVVVVDGSIPDAWEQTDWSGGAGAPLFTAANQYSSDSGTVDTSVSGTVRLASAPVTCQDTSWSFDTPAEYVFDSNILAMSGGLVTQKEQTLSVIPVSHTWDFSTTTDYVVTTGSVAVHNGMAETVLKADDVDTVALYHLDDTTGASFVDASDYGNTLQGYAVSHPNQGGKFGSSLWFDGIGNDYAMITDAAQKHLDGMGALTIDAWLYRTGTSTVDASLLRKWSSAPNLSYALQSTKTGGLRLYVSSNGTQYTMITSVSNVIPLSQWTHVAAVYDGTKLYLFANGQQVATPVNFTGGIANTTAPVMFNFTGNNTFLGRVDELRVSRVARWVSAFSVPTQSYGRYDTVNSFVTPVQSLTASRVQSWTSFEHDASVPSTSTDITYQLSADNGATWQYWSGSSWSIATNTSTHRSTASDVNAHIATFPIATGKLTFRAFLSGDGTSSISLNSVQVGYSIPSTDEATVGLWHFNEPSGELRDSSGRNNHLPVTGSLLYRQGGVFQTSILFDTNTMEYGRISDSAQSGLDSPTALTIDTWIRRVSTTTADSVIVYKWANSTGRSYAFQVSPLGALRFYVSSNGSNYTLASTPNGAVPHNSWTHVAVVYDGAWLRFFVNGQPSGTPLAFAGPIWDGDSPFQVSQVRGSALNGYMDELRVSNIARWTSAFTPSPVPYGSTNNPAAAMPTIRPVSAYTPQQMSQWHGFSEVAQKNSGDIYYQLSTDNGTTWQYWNGSSWAVATSTYQYGGAADINEHIWALPRGDGSLVWRAFMIGDAQLDQVHVSCATLQMEAGEVVLSASTTPILFAQKYTRPVLVATAESSSVPAVVRVSHLSSSGADLSLFAPNGVDISATRVSYMVVEEGVWSVDGVPVEARRMTAAPFSHFGMWNAPITTFRQSFTAPPVVLAQTLTSDDTGFATALVTGLTSTSTPTTTTMRLGLYGHEVSTSHTPETIGWIALGAGAQVVVGDATLQTNLYGSVSGYDQGCSAVPLTTPWSVPPLVLAASQALMSDDGGWAVQCSTASQSTVGVLIDEDTVGDVERSTNDVPVGYLAISQPFAYSASTVFSGGYKRYGQLYSSAVSFGAVSSLQRVQADTVLSPLCTNCSVELFVRTAPQSGTVPGLWSAWYGPVVSGIELPQWLQNNTWVQYRADLSGDGDSTPVLEKVRIEYFQ